MRSKLRVTMAVALVLFLHSGADSATVPPDDLEDLAASPRIFTGTLIEVKSRWNAQQTLIVTDHVFRVDDAIRGEFADTYVLTQGGGTVGSETHALSDLPRFSRGERYLLCLNQRDNTVFSGVRFGAFGALRVDEGLKFEAHFDDGRQLVGLSEFEALVAATPVKSDRQRQPAGPALLAKDYAPALGPLAPFMLPAESDPLVPPNRALASPIAASVPNARVGPLPSFSWIRRPNPPVTFNQLPASFTPWSPLDQHMMAEWNRFGDVYRVLVTPTGTWAWGNGRFDIAGFPTDAQMNSQFGQGWGPDTLGITFARWTTGPILEADIALNPAFGWTTDEAFGTVNGNGVWGFRQTMLHELGHAWGLQHPFESQNVFWPSVMNYGPKWSRGPRLHSDDTAAIRSAYPGLSLHDGALSAYHTADNAASMQANYFQLFASANVTHGGLLTFFNNMTLENLGTTPIVNPTILVHLTESRMTYSGAVYQIGNLQYAVTIAPFPNAIQPLIISPLPVPSSVPTGVYFPAVYLNSTGSVEASLGNNADWVGSTASVRVSNQAPLIVPTTSQQFSGSGNIGPLGWWDFQINAETGRTYLFATCGEAAFDTVIEVFRAGLLQGTNDDGCGTQSTLTWTSTFTGAAIARVRGWSASERGNFRMSYSHFSNAVFASGFE